MIEPTGEVHPAAAMFPMMSDDELDELAADIAANGQREPIVLLADGTLLDGRNRLAGCKLADVAPTFVVYDGDDPDGFVASRNIHRRNMTPSQRAMLVVKLGDKRLSRAASEAVGVSQPMVVHARKVAEHAPDLVDAVIAGTIPVKRAADEANRRRIENEQLAAVHADDLRWLAYVRRAHPELAERYEHGDATRPQVQDEIDGLELNATTQPKLVVDRVIAAMTQLRQTVHEMALSAERWPLGDHAERLPTSDEFDALVSTIRLVQNGDTA